MKDKGFIDLCFVKLDIAREKRRGLPEIIYAPGKTTAQLRKIIRKFRNHTQTLFISRLSAKDYTELRSYFPTLSYFKSAALAFLGKPKIGQKGYCLVVSAGTSDINVAEEAAIFLELTGNKVERIYDVGAAGLHRIEPYKNKIRKAKVIIVVAGMEAALLSIISGLASAPVIGVPTSIGYGAAFKGVAALLAMLNCCSLGTVVVNIDNGLGAGYFAHLINK
jgi:NCAIR mutase (PurE)-related protein